MTLPEDSPAKTIATSVMLGALGDIPGFGFLVGGIQGSIQAAARARDEDFWAMVNARISSLEAWAEGVVDLSNSEFLASAHRLFRAAQETADDDKRARLAAALAYAGPWSGIARDQRERMERVVTDLTSREVGLLKILEAPGTWLKAQDPVAYASYEWDFAGTFGEFLEVRVAQQIPVEIRSVHASNESLQQRSFVGLWERGEVGRNHLFGSKVTNQGKEFLRYLRAIEH